MTPKEKARQLYDEYRIKFFGSLSYKTLAKQCALMAANEILNIKSVNKDYDLSNYWEQVKEEINKL
jgi:hypothetical protein